MSEEEVRLDRKTKQASRAGFAGFVSKQELLDLVKSASKQIQTDES
jgi:hypothetical protein